MFTIASNYPSDWSSRSSQVYRRDDYTCQNCGKGSIQDDVELHAHHIVPVSKGGSHNKSNLKTLCKVCHNSIHHNNKKARTHQSHEERTHKNKAPSGGEPLSFDEIYERWGEVPGFPDYNPEDTSTHPSRAEAPDLATNYSINNQLVFIWAVSSFLIGYSVGGFLNGLLFMVGGTIVLGIINFWLS